MKSTPLVHEQRRTFTLEKSAGDFKPENADYKNGLYELPVPYVRYALLKDALFCNDVMAYGFPINVIVLPADTAETFDVVVTWSLSY